jgi:glycosyltransferase involved in cell wall biosynthesis
MPKVSVIIPALNCEKYIGNCLNHLFAQSYPIEKTEIIIVDNGSTDNTESIIDNYPVKKLKCLKKGPAAARNLGIKNSHGEILIFIDSDCLADKNLIKNHVQAHLKFRKSDPRVKIIGGGIKGYNQNLWSLCDDFCSWSLFHFNLTPRFEHRLCPTANMSIDRDILNTVGVFDEDLFFGEDYTFCNKALKHDFLIYFEPQAFTQHINRTTFHEFIHHAKNWAEADLDLYRLDVLKLKKRFSHFVFYYFIFFFCLNLQPIYSGLLARRFYVIFLSPFIFINRSYIWFIRVNIHRRERKRAKTGKLNLSKNSTAIPEKEIMLSVD